MSMKLRDLIRAVRACKTAAEERAVISKECALIRTAIKEEDEQFRYRNVAKLMYIHMLGYPTHFGQMECLKLVSSPTFQDKRIGYLGLTLLLNEQAEVLTLVTNSLKLDLTSNNQYIQGLALISIGNLATQDMARDLISDIEKILKSNNSYLRKKAALATIRLLRKEPDLIEHMVDKVPQLLKDRAHGVLLTGIQLMIDILAMSPETKAEYSKLVPALVRQLRTFISMGYSPEHDVSGITDPFVQVALLRVLRLLGKSSDEASEQMNDVLAQVATNTESAKNAGNAILYECVRTIMEVQSDSSLRVLAVNILGRFLLNRDNNIRYVALNSLSKVVTEDIAAVQRHRNTIVECLKDADVSIRQRALELIYQLVNEQNVIALTTELLNYLVVCGSDQKAALCSKITQIVEKYSPGQKWRVDTIITMLTVAGNHVDESVVRTAILFLAQAEGLQGYATHKLYQSILEDTSQLGMLQVGIWCIGEFGDLLARYSSIADNDGSNITHNAVPEAEIIQTLDKCMKVHNVDLPTKAIILNALIKLSVRFSSAYHSSIQKLLLPYQRSMSLELQQRSVEYGKLLNSTHDGLRGELLGKMPIVDESKLRKKRGFDENSGSDSLGSPAAGGSIFDAASPVVSHAPAGGSSLLDLDDIFGGGASPVKAATAPVQAAPAMNNALDIFGLGSSPVAAAPAAAKPAFGGNDLLADIFSQSVNVSSPLPPTPMAATVPPAGLDLLGGLGMAPLNPSPVAGSNSFGYPPAAMPTMPIMPVAPMMSANPTIPAFDKAGLKVVMELSKPVPGTQNVSKILCKFSNSLGSQMDNLVFQAAVPKYLKLEMLPPSSTSIPANSMEKVTQEIKVTNSMQGEKNIMLKLKITYTVNGSPVEEMAQVSNFPNLY